MSDHCWFCGVGPTEAHQGTCPRSWNGLDWSSSPALPADPRTCVSCRRELCAELDTYWGLIPYGKDYCSPCRIKAGIK